jgi:hypothetical protein
MAAEGDSFLAEKGVSHVCFTAEAGGGPVQKSVASIPWTLGRVIFSLAF